MRVFLVEWACSRSDVPFDGESPYLAEGRAMLAAVAEDLVQGGIEVVTIARSGLIEPAMGVEVHDPIGDSGFYPMLKSLASSCDFAITIAPECDGILEEMVAEINKAHVTHLACLPATVAMCADKAGLHKFWKARGVPTPETWVDLSQVEWGSPLVIKPRRGAGCERTVVCQDACEVGKALEQLGGHFPGDFIIQKWVPGTPGSIACLARTGKSPVFMPACGQMMENKDGLLTYKGGWGPVSSEWQYRAERLALHALEGLEGLNGWVGVDLVFGQCSSGVGDQAIEVNPRLTSSYLGIRKMVFPLPALLWVGAVEGPLAWSDNHQIRLRWTKTGQLSTQGDEWK